MARPIKETPTLHGEDARVFEERIARSRPVSSEEYVRAKKDYGEILSIAKFKF